MLPPASENVILKRDQDDYFAMDMLSGEVFHLNETAATIFEFCRQGLSYEAAVEQLAANLSEPGQESLVREDLKETVSLLQELGLCERSQVV